MNVTGNIAQTASLAAGTRRGNTRAFTLVEMLAVILVIGILVAVVVGFTRRGVSIPVEKQTRLNMQAIMNAIGAYHEEKGAYPNPGGTDYRQANAGLYSLLRGCALARKRVGELSRSAYKVSGGNTYFVDGFEQVLKYFATGGAGGGPFLESPGRDGDFNSKDDNIRSDNH